ncbi:MAG TPA: DegT/DnrJ/EryC1/StrS aminotransferase family protein [Candidatus Baltobacteraceae bacterium]|nr:DegT/DnrJ/EryC1/StrS aminotransferase family protein [Candidatus Baltobacteraceae bacterium]
MRDQFLPYCRPDLSDDELSGSLTALREGWLTTGPNVRAFEAQFATAAGVRHAIAVNSCTAALHVALRAFGVGSGDDVVMPSLTFVAGAQCTLELGATPVFADVDPETFSVTPETIARVLTPRTKVIMPMPYAGRPLDIAPIVELAHARGIRVLEDAAHAAGMLDRGRWSGACSDAAAYSFYATKNLTTCEGGMLLTNDDALAERARILSLHGMDRDAWKRYTASGSWRYDVTEPGYKYNLPDPLAAIGIGQLRRLAEMQARRDELAALYADGLREIPGITLQAPAQNPGDRTSWCMFVVIVDEVKAGITRDDLIEALREQNIGTSVHYIPTHLFKAYRFLRTRTVPQTERVWKRLLSLPLYPSMSDADAQDVVAAIKGAILQQTQPNRVNGGLGSRVNVQL